MSCKIYTRNIYGRKGDIRLPINLTFKDASGNKMIITNYSFAIQIKEKDGDVVASATVNPSTSSLITLNFHDTDTSVLIWGFGNKLTLDSKVYTYAIKMTDAGKSTTIISGEFIVEPELVTIP